MLKASKYTNKLVLSLNETRLGIKYWQATTLKLLQTEPGNLCDYEEA
jgi:hypothetical protein